MDAFDILESLRDPHTARHYGNVGNEGNVAHELIALTPRIASEDLQLALIRSQAEHRVERGALARAIRADDAEDAALVNVEVHAVQCDCGAKHFAESVCFYAGHVNAPLS